MLGLIYVNIIGKNSENEYMYEFYFSEEPDMAWGTDWDIKPAAICNLEVPQKQTYDIVKTLRTEYIFNVAQKNSCFSYQDCKDGILPVAWENIDNLEEYPEDGRFVFPFGCEIFDVEQALSKRDLLFENSNSDPF